MFRVATMLWIVAGASVAASAAVPLPKLEIVVSQNTTVEACFSFNVGGVFATLEKSQCLIYDVQENSGTFSIKLCGGLKVEEGGKVMNLGATASASTVVCHNFEVKVKAASLKKAQEEILSVDGVKMIEAELKERLGRMSDEELQKVGLSREQLKSITLKVDQADQYSKADRKTLLENTAKLVPKAKL